MLTGFPLLSTMILLPCVGAVATILFTGGAAARICALGTALMELAHTGVALFSFDRTSEKIQFVEEHAWIPSLQIDYLVGLDGLSILFPTCTALLTVAVIIGSWTHVQSMARLYFALVLLLEGLTIGLFCALDIALFFLFWELTLVPIYFLIGLWGLGPRRRFAATQYTLYMLIGSVPILFAMILLALDHATRDDLPIPAGLTFNYLALLSQQADSGTQATVFLLFVIGFGIKTPLVPFHSWLPNIAMEGPVGLTALVTGIKVGVYGLMRLAIPLAPEAATHFAPWLTGLGIAGVFYGALLALRQQNLRPLLAYASVSHVGLVVVALSVMNLTAIQGALFQLANFSVTSGGLFLVAGCVQQRLGSTDRVHLGGLAGPMPLLTGFAFLFLLAGIGIPGTTGFVAEWLMLLGIFEHQPGLALAGIAGTVLSAAYTVTFFGKGFLGPTVHRNVQQAQDLRRRELALLSGLAIILLSLGLCPRPIIGLVDTATIAWVKRLGGGPLEQPSQFASAATGDL